MLKSPNQSRKAKQPKKAQVEKKPVIVELYYDLDHYDETDRPVRAPQMNTYECLFDDF